MILNDFTEPKEKFSREKLDAVLAELCELVIKGQQDNPDFNGMVAAAVLDPKGRLATGVNYLYGNGRIHAERAAIDRYEEQLGELPPGCIVITTLSPCSQDTHDNRHGDSCTEFLNSKRVKMAYCGYKDPTQEDLNKFTVVITSNKKIEELCKSFADTFLKENFADGKVKGQSRPGRVKRAGASCSGSVTDLRKRAKNSSGEKSKMYHWCANMKSGRQKTNEGKPVLEIQRIPVGDFGDAETLVSTGVPRNAKPLPGGSGYKYAVNDTGSLKEIMIFDKGNLVAELDLKPTNDPIGSWEVASVATQPEYRGKGLGQSLYGIALSILKLTLRAGKTQTKHGREMWLKLNNIPGVEVKGITTTPKSQYKNRPGTEVLWDTGKNIVHTFPITSGATSMKSAQAGRGLYNNQNSSMIARWTGK